MQYFRIIGYIDITGLQINCSGHVKIKCDGVAAVEINIGRVGLY